jgi:hypothetical protein
MRLLPALLPLALLVSGPARADPAGEARTSRTFVFVYEANLASVPGDARQVRLWIPVPTGSEDQDVADVKVALTVDGAVKEVGISADGALEGTAPLACTVAPIGHGWGRSLCVESAGKAFAVRMTAKVTRRECNGTTSATKETLAAASGPDRLVPLGGKASAAARKVGDGTSAGETARLIYEHVLERMKYDKPTGQPWGRGDAEWACEAGFGNCTDFHSYFLALARTKGIPARFEMGFSVPGGSEPEAQVGGYHCWAFFWDGAKWVPVDISEADKNPDKAEYFFGTLDADRVTFTGGRDLELTPAPAAGPLNFFVYPYAEIDGKEWKEVQRSFKRLLLPPR